MTDARISCTPAGFTVLRLLAGGADLTPRQRRSMTRLERDRLVNGDGSLTWRGEDYLQHHRLVDGRVVACDRRCRVTRATIRADYGMTDRMVDELLPPPMTAPNPYYKAGPPMRLWFDDEVAVVAARPEVAARVAEAVARRERRSQAAKRAADRRRAATRERVTRAIERIHVKVVGLEKLRERAIRAREAWYDATDRWEEASEARFAPEHVIQRWMVNYVRHHLTDYEKTLYGMRGQVGCHKEYARYRTAVMAAIADAYPELSEAVLDAEQWLNENTMPVPDDPYGFRKRLEEERAARGRVGE